VKGRDTWLKIAEEWRATLDAEQRRFDTDRKLYELDPEYAASLGITVEYITDEAAALVELRKRIAAKHPIMARILAETA
jgi:hypothetical protein